jgi:hypothetical protein
VKNKLEDLDMDFITRFCLKGMKLTITDNHYKFWHYFKIYNNKESKAYLKSKEFKDYVLSVFKKYEGISYGELNSRREEYRSDFKLIEDKLDAFHIKEPAKPAEPEPFKVDFYFKLIKRYCNGIKVNVNFYNNIDGRRIYYKTFIRTQTSPYLVDKLKSDFLIESFYYELKDRVGDLLKDYTSWDEFILDSADWLDKDVCAIADELSFPDVIAA